jgi:hypothetical protein
MRLYPKRLRGIEDLEREKRLLRKETRALDADDTFSLEGVMKGGDSKTRKKKKNKERKEAPQEEKGKHPLLGLLGIDNPLAEMAMGFIQSKLAGAGEDVMAKVAKKGKNILISAAKEFIGGYLKWKTIELSYKGIKYLVNKRKENKEAEKPL